MGFTRIKYSDIEKYPHYFKLSQNLKENFFGSSPSVFVGTYSYPNVNVGLLAPQETKENAYLHDAPQFWAYQNYKIPSIVDLRLSLINARTQSNIKSQSKINQLAQLVGMASKPTDIEVQLAKKPIISPLTDRTITPMGPAGQIKHVELAQNPTIPTKVEKVHSDIDLKSKDALIYLYTNDVDENTLSKILSVAAIGIGKNRKLVPTRWSITATDTTFANHLIEQIKDFQMADYAVYTGDYLGNYYVILMFPDVYSYELFEVYLAKNISPIDISYSTDYEPNQGRTTYAENCAGGFYSVRLAIAEHLNKTRRQAAILALRFITDEYNIPLGVWVTREASRKAMNSKHLTFASKELMLNYVKEFIQRRFGFEVSLLLKESKLMNEQKKQLKLASFL